MGTVAEPGGASRILSSSSRTTGSAIATAVGERIKAQMEGTVSISEIRRALGSPYYEAEGLLLYNVDCIDALRGLPPTIVDLTITSPPYNIGKAYESPREIDDYLHWCEEWMREVHRVTNSRGAFWLNLGYFEVPSQGKAVPIPYLLWDRTDFFLVQEIVWNYGAGVHTKKLFSPRNEKFLWYVKNDSCYLFNLDSVRDPNVKYPNQKKNGKLKCNPLGKNPSDVWQIPKVTSGMNRASKERTAHPAQFPIAVIDRIVKACSNPSDIVLDPFMGSGSTAIAALENGRSVVGFEISEEYCDLAASRMRRYLQQREHRSAQAVMSLGV